MPPVAAPTGELGSLKDSTSVTFAYLKESNRRSFFEILDRFQGSKAVVWDPDLMKPFGLIAGFKELQQHGVSNMFPLQKGSVPTAAVDHVVFLTKPTLQRTEWVGENLRTLRKEDKRQYHLVFVPRSSVLCEQKLKEMNATDRLSTIEDLSVFFFPTDTDLATMESSLVLENCLLYDDWSSLYDLVAAIDQLETVFGRVSRICYKGDWSQQVFKLLQKKREQDSIAAGKAASAGAGAPSGQEAALNRVPLIDTILMIDRWVDPITPLITQLTYEGLIDEIFSIRCGKLLPLRLRPRLRMLFGV